MRRSRPRHARTSSPTQTILAHATHATRRDARRCDRAPNHIPPRCMHCRTLAGPVRCSHLPWRVALGTACGGRMQSNAEHGRRGLAAVGRPSDRAGRIAWLAWHVLNGSPRSTPLSPSMIPTPCPQAREVGTGEALDHSCTFGRRSVSRRALRPSHVHRDSGCSAR